MIPKIIFKNRRKNLIDLIRKSDNLENFYVLLYSGMDKNNQRFEVEPNFYYLTGLNSKETFLIIKCEKKNYKEYLFLPPADPQKERYEGKQLSYEDIKRGEEEKQKNKELRRVTGFSNIFSNSEIFSFLKKNLKEKTKIYYKNYEALFFKHFEGIKDLEQGHETVDVSKYMRILREVKDKLELSLIRKAIDIAIEAHYCVMKSLTREKSERELYALIKYIFTKNGSDEAFPSIVASGSNSTILHYNENQKELKRGELLICDIGAKYKGYCSDLTRTYPVSGKFGKEHLKYYEFVLEAQEMALTTFREGITIGDVNKKLFEFYKEKGYENYFYHGVSHHIGLETHDIIDVQSPLKENAIITVEPGLYIKEKGIGIRIEDDILIKKNGNENLSKDLIKDPQELEKRIKTSSFKIVI